MHTERALRIGSMALVSLLLITAGKVSFDLLKMLSWEIPGPMHGDTGIYTYMARALLNGLKPYVDLYDAKPPGIYLLFALSLLLTKGNALVTFLQIVTFVLTPVLCALVAFRSCDSKVRSWKLWVLVCASFIASSLFVLYTEERAGGLQPEGFGYFFSILYALLILKTQLKSKWSIILASFAFLTSMGLKEPFIVTNLAIALLLTRSSSMRRQAAALDPEPTKVEGWKELPRTFLLPLAAASIAGIIGLLILGMFKAYLTMHLPNMFMYRTVVTTGFNPMWLRGLNTSALYDNIVGFYPTGRLTGWLMIFLWLSTPLLLIRSPIKWVPTVSTWIIVLCMMIAMKIIEVIIYVTKEHPGSEIAFAPANLVLIALIVGGCVVLWLHQRSLIPKVLLTLLAFYLTVFTVGIGGAYHPNFFVFAVPVYTALLLLWIDRAGSGSAPMPVALAIIALTIAAGLSYRSDPKHVENFRTLTENNYAENREEAARLDALLDACGFDRYVSAVNTPAFAYSLHSPWGPLTGLIEPRYMPPDNPYTRKTAENILERTEIIIHDEEEWDRPIINANLELIEGRFTEEPPDCAKPHLPFHDYTVLFRRKGS